MLIISGCVDTQVGMHPKRMFNITSRPCPELNNRNFPVGIGCVVGGSSIVNGQVFLRGTAEEYDAWEALGPPNSTWNWKGLLPYFKKVDLLCFLRRWASLIVSIGFGTEPT